MSPKVISLFIYELLGEPFQATASNGTQIDHLKRTDPSHQIYSKPWFRETMRILELTVALLVKIITHKVSWLTWICLRHLEK